MRIFSGQRAFLVQRISALLLLAWLIALTMRLALGPPVSSVQWREWVAQPIAASALLLAAAAILVHAWVGVRDVALDYIRPIALRLAVVTLAACGLLALAAWTGFIVLRHAL